ncbi:hypothetical protein DM01DRAFT_1377151 [Hesseltinella vesiculosa]|uniref:Uncharacterized protein n=1 Tax=Hesseltinella vesiculosa TaxID=101127 RepID=A0A1X2G7Z0_9FUNG|nr:hypothetical protein DM01DRAFT_1377151 [Hesseltinella vesiculosa]
MSDVYPTLGWSNVGIATLFILVGVVISARLGLQLEKQLIIAATRCAVQLMIMGLILRDIFEARKFGLVMGLTVLMVFLSVCETVYSKAGWRHQGYFPAALLSMFGSTLLVGVIGCKYALGQHPFWYPEYFIPTIGLLLGPSGALSMAVDYVLYQIRVHMDQVETYLAMGATRWEAVQHIAREAIRLSSLPMITQMSIVGAVVIPGAMAGQIMMDIPIHHAVLYQQITTFLITSWTCFSVISMVIMTLFAIVDDHHRIRPERIQKANSNIIQDIYYLLTTHLDPWFTKHTPSSKNEETTPLLTKP